MDPLAKPIPRPNAPRLVKMMGALSTRQGYQKLTYAGCSSCEARQKWNHVLTKWIHDLPKKNHDHQWRILCPTMVLGCVLLEKVRGLAIYRMARFSLLHLLREQLQTPRYASHASLHLSSLKKEGTTDTFLAVSKPSRYPLKGFPNVLIHSEIDSGQSTVKKHPSYTAAKSGDDEAARDLVRETINDQQVEVLRHLLDGRRPILVSVHAYESEGVNAIPEKFAEELADRLGLETDTSIVQTNVVSHTGASGYCRLARPPEFDGEVIAGAEYVLVDDFVGQGGTLANLRGYIESKGGRVIAAVTLTGQPRSAKWPWIRQH